MLKRLNRDGLVRDLAVLCFAVLVLCVTADAAWAGGDGCGKRITGPATITAAFFVDGEGGQGGAGRPLVVGKDVTFADGRTLDSLELPLEEAIHSGVLVNEADRRVALLFSNGETALLEPGETLAVGNARCECRCTCKTSTGTSKVFTFPCSSNSDTCNYNGDLCQWPEGGVVQTGFYSTCIKVWVAAEPDPVGN